MHASKITTYLHPVQHKLVVAQDYQHQDLVDAQVVLLVVVMEVLVVVVVLDMVALHHQITMANNNPLLNDHQEDLEDHRDLVLDHQVHQVHQLKLSHTKMKIMAMEVIVLATKQLMVSKLKNKVKLRIRDQKMKYKVSVVRTHTQLQMVNSLLLNTLLMKMVSNQRVIIFQHLHQFQKLF